MFFKNKKAKINLSMFDFFTPKTKVRYFALREVPIEDFEVIGISQINPYCNKTYDNEIFLTVVNFANTSRRFDEKEGLILSEYFTVRSLYELLMTRSESRIHETKSIVSAANASAEDIHLLQVDANTPMLCFHNISRRADGTVLDYAFARYRGDLNKFELIDTPHLHSDQA